MSECGQVYVDDTPVVAASVHTESLMSSPFILAAELLFIVRDYVQAVL